MRRKRIQRNSGVRAFLRKNCRCFIVVMSLFGVFHLIDSFLGKNIDDNKSPAGFYRDYAKVNGLGDLTSDFVEPWCFYGHKDCNCEDPIDPHHHLKKANWAKAHHLNKEQAIEHGSSVDVLFLGDSITERWNGMGLGYPLSKAHDVPQVFHKLFTTKGGGDFEGLALGISGDTSSNLLWRIQNGELPTNLNPSLIWLLIGTNDFGNTWCSAEVVVIGILRVVEELLLRKPGSKIVINGLMPRTYNKKGYVNRGREKKKTFAHSQRAMPSMWEDIEAVNDEVKRYCKNNAKVEYFETDVFFEDASVSEESLKIDKSLMSDYLHPTAEGYELWGKEIVLSLRKFLPTL